MLKAELEWKLEEAQAEIETLKAEVAWHITQGLEEEAERSEAESAREKEDEIKASFQARAERILNHLRAPFDQFDCEHEIKEMMLDIQEWVYVAGVA